MAKQSLLIVDADERSLRVLEVSLRGAGYNVASCGNAGKALEVLHANRPDLILADTRLPDINGFELVERLRANPKWAGIPFMFLSSDGSVESKIRGLELGVGDYLTKPVYIREVISRVGLELAKRKRNGLAERTSQHPNLNGSLADMSVADLLHTIDDSQKSGVLYLVSWNDERGAIFFESGSVIHAHVGELRGEDAVFKLMLWSEGSFDFEFRRVRDGERTVEKTTAALLMEGMRRIDERERLSEQLPPSDAVLELDDVALRERLKEMPDAHNSMLRLIDGNRTLAEIVGLHGGDDLDALRKVVGLYFEGVVRQVGVPVNSIPVVDPESPESHRAGPDTLPGPGGGSIPSEYSDVPPAPAAPSSRSRQNTPLGFQSAPVGADDPEADRPTSRPPSPEMFMARQMSEPSGSEPTAARGDRMKDTHIGGWRAKSDPPEGPDEPLINSDKPAAASVDEEDRITPVSDPAPGQAIGRLKGNTILNWAGGKPSDRASEDDASSSVHMKPLTGENEIPHAALAEARAAAADADMSERATRVSEEDWLEDQLSRETVVGDPWDDTLRELRVDPEIDDAIAAIDSDPPPAAIVESKPPMDRHVDDAISRGMNSESEELERQRAAVEEAAAAAAEASAHADDASAVDPEDEDVEILFDYAPPAGLHLTPLTYDEIIEEEEYEERRRQDPLRYAEPLGRPAPVVDEYASLRSNRRPLVWYGVAVAVAMAAAGLFVRDQITRSEEVAIERTVKPEPVVPTPVTSKPAKASAKTPAAKKKPSVTKKAKVSAKPAPATPALAKSPATTKPAPAKPAPAKSASVKPAPPKTVPPKPVAAKPVVAKPATPAKPESTSPAASSYDVQLAEAKRLRRGAAAIAAYRKAIEINPRGAEAHIELAFLELNRGKIKEAQTLAERATKLDPTSSKAWVTLGAAKQQLRDRAGAQEAYTQCVQRGTGKFVRECRAMLR